METALAVSLVSLSGTVLVAWLNIRHKIANDMEAAYRKTLEPHLPKLASSLHQVIASTAEYAKKITKNGSGKESWKKRIIEARGRLKESRLETLYPLWGLGEPIHTITRLPNFIENAQGDTKKIEALIDLATELRKAIDECVRLAFLIGRPPTPQEVEHLALLTTELRNCFNGVEEIEIEKEA